MNAHWLYAIEEPVGDWTPGTTGSFWVHARVDPDTERVIRRTDGMGAGEPRWRVGHDVVVYHSTTKRCVALLRVATDPSWNEAEERWDFELEIVARDWDGPPAKALGIVITQGARKKLSPAQFERARSALTR